VPQVFAVEEALPLALVSGFVGPEQQAAADRDREQSDVLQAQTAIHGKLHS
jgi:hypothetical protein